MLGILFLGLVVLICSTVLMIKGIIIIAPRYDMWINGF